MRGVILSVGVHSRSTAVVLPGSSQHGGAIWHPWLQVTEAARNMDALLHTTGNLNRHTLTFEDKFEGNL